jgi:LysM repeat protein
MKKPSFLKKPKFLTKLAAMMPRRPQKKLNATARAARQTMEDYDSEEPTTKLSSAFIVVLILHVVAVGGIYAFNSIKASRRDHDTSAKTSDVAAPIAGKPASTDAVTAAAANNPAAALHRVEPNAAAATAHPAGAHQYEVKASDTLTKIAFAYKTTSAEIMATNNLKEGAVLRPGQMLVIPAAKATPKPAVEAPKTAATANNTAAATAAPAAATPAADIPPTRTTPGLYTVKKGDTLTSIAKTYGLSLDDLSKANKITDPKKLQLGQVLKVPPRKS